MIVDTHVHPLASDLTRYPRKSGASQDAAWIEGAHLTAEEFVTEMDRAGVGRAVLVQAATAHGFDNSYCADSAAAHPDRFVAVCRIDPEAEDAPDALSYWVRDRGCSGVRLGEGGNTGVDNPWMDDPKTHALWQRAEHLGIPVCLQLRKTDLPRVGPILERFSAVTVLLDHLAHASIAELAGLARYPNFHLKFSTMNVRENVDAQRYFRSLADAFGAERLLWSSDYPHTKGTAEAPYRGCLELAQGALALLTEEERRWALGETAQRVYPGLRAVP